MQFRRFRIDVMYGGGLFEVVWDGAWYIPCMLVRFRMFKVVSKRDGVKLEWKRGREVMVPEGVRRRRPKIGEEG